MFHCFFLIGLLIFSFHNAHAGETKNDRVVAIVNDFRFYVSDIEHARKQLPSDIKQYSKAAVFEYLLNNLIDTHLVAADARKVGFDKRHKIAKRLRRSEEQILYQAYLDERILKSLSDKRLMVSYKKYLRANSATEEIRARHILLQTQRQAAEVIRQLNAGKDFANLAKLFSTGPSGKNGGDLGYFTRERMVKLFSEAAFATPVGKFTLVPVKTQFGWHVIKVEDKRILKPKTFDEIKGQLREKMISDSITTIVSKLRKSAKIKIFDDNKK